MVTSAVQDDILARTAIDPRRLETRIHEVTNHERHQRGRQSLARDSDLELLARYHSSQMREMDGLYHVSPGGESLSDRAQLFDYRVDLKIAGQAFCHACGADLRAYANPKYCPDCGSRTPYDNQHGSEPDVLAENVAFHQYEADQMDTTDEGIIANSVVNGWLNSPGHRENLLAETFERVAVGVDITVERDGTVQIYITQNLS